MHVRRAVRGDEAEVIGLMRQFMAFEKTDLLSDEDYKKMFRAVIGQPERIQFIVAETGGILAGVMTVVIGFSTWRGKTFLTIDDVYVKPEARHQGVATALLEYAFAMAKEMGCARVDLLTEIDNHPAQELYKKLGFIRMPRIQLSRPM